MRCVKLTLSYDGTNFAGWQAQQGNIRTVQGVLEAAWLEITQESVRAAASGRTDSGVHALGQVVSIKTESALPAQTLRRALNSQLPHDVIVLEAEDVQPEFHAILDTVRKRYRYVIHDSRLRNVFQRPYLWQIFHRLDTEAMHRAAQALVGKHNFTSFQATSDKRVSSVRTIFEISVERGAGENSDFVTIEVEADGFLYNMVRIIVGTLYVVGRKRQPEAWIAEVLAAQNREAAGETAPAQGLFLVSVQY